MSSDKASDSWYCLRCEPKREHIAAAILSTEPGAEVYLPRIRFLRPTRRGPAWFTEALFPGYLFARFDAAARRKLHHAPAVKGVVHFGDNWPTVPQSVVDELRRIIGDSSPHIVSEGPEQQDTSGNLPPQFRALRSIISRFRPSAERLAVLMELWGQEWRR